MADSTYQPTAFILIEIYGENVYGVVTQIRQAARIAASDWDVDESDLVVRASTLGHNTVAEFNAVRMLFNRLMERLSK